jgi:hypothetical protein
MLLLDPMGITGALTSLKAILDLAKSANDAQLAIKISSEVIEAQSKLLTTQQQAFAMFAENEQLRNELAKYKIFGFHHSVHWRKLPDGDLEDGPFCPVCLAEGVEMRLHLRSSHVDGKHLNFQCPKVHPGPSTREPNGATYKIPRGLIATDKYIQED